MTPRGPSPWSADLTVLCQRIARRLLWEGASHPQVAAVVMVVRGQRRLGRADAAALVGITVEGLRAIESGQVAWAELPEPMRADVRNRPDLDLARFGLV